MSVNLFTIANNMHKKTIFIFVHGVFDSSGQAVQYREILPNAIVVSFDFNDAMRIPFLYRPFLSSLGQEDEIKKLNYVYESIVTSFQQRSYPVPRIVLIGVSRGASVILNFLALKKPEYVTAAICESPFDSMEHVADYTFSGLPASVQGICKKLSFRLFCKHDLDGINPIDCVGNIDQNVPILLIASKQDSRIPLESTEQLYNIMKKSGKNVQFKIFERGGHAKILKANKTEYGKIVRKFLAF